MGGNAENQHGDGGLISGAISSFSSAIVPFTAGLLITHGKQPVSHPLVVLLPHLSTNLIQRVGRVVVTIPVMSIVVLYPFHELDCLLDVVCLVFAAELEGAHTGRRPSVPGRGRIGLVFVATAAVIAATVDVLDRVGHGPVWHLQPGILGTPKGHHLHDRNGDVGPSWRRIVSPAA